MPARLVRHGAPCTILQSNRTVTLASAKSRPSPTTCLVQRTFRLRRLLPAQIALALAAPGFAQTLHPECKASVDQTWFDAHKEGLPSEIRQNVFRNAVGQLLNPVVTQNAKTELL